VIGYEGAPRYASAIRAITGDTDICPPGLTLESDRPEYSYVKREGLWVATFVCAALAANFNQFTLAEGTADKLGIVTHLFSSVDVKFGMALIGGSAAGPGTAGGIAYRDARWPGKPNVRQFNKQAAASVFATTAFLFVPANQLVAVPPHVFTPSPQSVAATFVVESNVVNVAQVLGVAGYERYATAEERADT